MPAVSRFSESPPAYCSAVTGFLLLLASIRKPTPVDIGRLLLVSAIWGSAFFCNAVALVDFTPLAIAGWRVALATLLIVGICRWKSLSIPTDLSAIRLFMAIGVLNSAVPFTLIGWGQQTVDSATTAILISASPFATLVLSHLMTEDDRFSVQKLIGLLVGFSGVLVLLARGMTVESGALPGMLAIMLAGCCYAASAVLIRRLENMSSLVIVAGSLCTSALVLLPLLVWRYPPWEQRMHGASLAAVMFLALGPTALAYVLRTRIVQLNGAVFMSGAGYLIPLFAVLWAWLFLSQKPAGHAWIALCLISAGIAIGQRRARHRHTRR